MPKVAVNTQKTGSLGKAKYAMIPIAKTQVQTANLASGAIKNVRLIWAKTDWQNYPTHNQGDDLCGPRRS